MEEAVAYIRTIMHRALSEDIGPGDVTMQALASPGDVMTGRVVLRSGGVVCGGFAVEETVSACSRFLGVGGVPSVELLVAEGKEVPKGTDIARVNGDASIILASERVFLNFLSFMTGVATLTRRYVEAVDGTNCKIMDTRKTVPMLRSLEKYAVRTGGGANHRNGLYDQILVKDNHLKLFHMDVAEAVRRAKEHRDENLPGTPVEIEAETIEQMIEAVRSGADIVLLDNMTPTQVAEAVKRRDLLKSKVKLEVSGGVTLENVRAYAETGVERISIGRLTHSAPAADVALDVES